MSLNANSKKSKFWYFLNNADIFVGGCALIALVVITFSGVIARRVFNSPFAWLEEMQSFFTLWLVFIASGAVFRTIDQIAIEIVVDSFRPTAKRIAMVLIYLVVMATLGFTLVRSLILIDQLINIKRVTNMLKIPYFLVYIPLPIGCVLMIISDTIVTVKRVILEPLKLKNDKEADAK